MNETVNATGGKVNHIFDYIATTNYDLVVETYANENENRSHYSIQRGFKVIPKGIGSYLDLPSLRQNFPNYLKLHGSIDWWKRDDGMIVISNDSKDLYGKNI